MSGLASRRAAGPRSGADSIEWTANVHADRPPTTTQMNEPIEFSYALHPLPIGRISFRRWRWELWHGPQLLAAGWRTGPLHAQRAVRVHAVRHAYRLHGLHPLRPDVGHAPETAWNGQPVAFSWGQLRLRLIPRAIIQGAVATG